MNRLLFSYFLFSLPILVSAQGISISGKIVIEELTETIDLSLISILNETTNAKTKANSLGVFTLKVAKDDVIIITSNFTEQRRVKISEAILNKGFITVHLDLEIIQLAEANINPLKKNLKDNISKEKSQQEKMYELIGFNEEFKLDMIKYRLALAYIKKYKGVTSYENVLNIKDQFTKDARNYQSASLRRLANKKVLRFDQILMIKSFLDPSYFINQLKISSSNIDEFINFCFDKYNFESLLKGEDYDQIMFYLSEEAPLYLNLLNDNS